MFGVLGGGVPVGLHGQLVAQMALCGMGATTLPGAKLRRIWQKCLACMNMAYASACGACTMAVTVIRWIPGMLVRSNFGWKVMCLDVISRSLVTMSSIAFIKSGFVVLKACL